MAVTRAAQAERTRQSILDTSRRLFLEHGFRTKIAILEALLEPTVTALTVRLDEAERITDRADRIDHLITTWVDQVVTAYRTLAPMSRHDPIVRRHEKLSGELDALSERGLHLMFGPHPTVDEQAAYWLISDLGVVNRRLDHLSDDDLRATLARLCRRVVQDVTAL
jgi:AcrR family transcriptional regulator